MKALTDPSTRVVYEPYYKALNMNKEVFISQYYRYDEISPYLDFNHKKDGAGLTVTEKDSRDANLKELLRPISRGDVIKENEEFLDDVNNMLSAPDGEPVYFRGKVINDPQLWMKFRRRFGIKKMKNN